MVANSSVIASYGSSTAQATVELATRLDEFQQTQRELGNGLAGSIETFRSRNAEQLTAQLAILDQHLASISGGAGVLGNIMDGSVEERSAFVKVVNQARSAIHASLGTWAEGFKIEMSTTTDGLMRQADEGLQAVSVARACGSNVRPSSLADRVLLPTSVGVASTGRCGLVA